MPIKNRSRPTNSGLKGCITNLTAMEIQVLKDHGFITDDQYEKIVKVLPTSIYREGDIIYLVHDGQKLTGQDDIDISATAVVVSDVDTATQGTLTEAQMEVLYNSDDAYCVLGNDLYFLNTKASTEGYLSYSHVAYESGTMQVKSIIVTVATLAWVLNSDKLSNYQLALNETQMAAVNSGITADDVASLKQLLDFIIYDKGTNSVRIGCNLEVDGKATVNGILDSESYYSNGVYACAYDASSNTLQIGDTSYLLHLYGSRVNIGNPLSTSRVSIATTQTGTISLYNSPLSSGSRMELNQSMIKLSDLHVIGRSGSSWGTTIFSVIPTDSTAGTVTIASGATFNVSGTTELNSNVTFTGDSVQFNSTDTSFANNVIMDGSLNVADLTTEVSTNLNGDINFNDAVNFTSHPITVASPFTLGNTSLSEAQLQRMLDATYGNLTFITTTDTVSSVIHATLADGSTTSLVVTETSQIQANVAYFYIDTTGSITVSGEIAGSGTEADPYRLHGDASISIGAPASA